MTQEDREHAVRVLRDIKNREYEQIETDENLHKALQTALTVLREPKPDPITGLVPCGCGEKAVTLVVRAVSVGYFAERICCKCHTKSTGFGVEAEDAVENVKNIWNTARGYKEDA